MTSFDPKNTIKELNPDAETSAVFVEPLPSRASRLPALRSTMSNRGEIFCAASGRIIVYESNLERRAAMIFCASPQVVDVWDQPTPISYIDASGVTRRHTFDFRVILKNGTKIAVVVKPMERAVARGLFDTMSLVASQLDPSFANKIVILTEEELDAPTAHDAEVVLIARRTIDPEADLALELFAKAQVGSVSANQIIDRLGLGAARGFLAIARAIGAGLLRRVSTGHLSVSSMIKSLVEVRR